MTTGSTRFPRTFPKPFGRRWSEFILGRRENLNEWVCEREFKVTVYRTFSGRIQFTDPTTRTGNKIRNSRILYRIRVRNNMNDSKWKHVKTGDIYVVESIGLLEESLKVMVTYRAYSKGGPLWIRPLNEFLDGRFVRVG